MKYRKKPVVIEAIQNDGTWRVIIHWLRSLHPEGSLLTPFGTVPPITRNEDGSLNIDTAEGVMRGDVGDWIIRGIKGEFYPCKDEIFRATYEKVDS